MSVWGIASLSSKDPFGFFQFKNVSFSVLDLLKCPQSFCNKPANYTGTVTGNSTLPAYGQCGGAGGECAKYGTCADMAFPGFKCTTGWSCQRQHRWYYQCLPGLAIPDLSTCDFSAFGEPMATMMKGLGMICTLKDGLMSFALNPTQVPKIIDPFAMLQVFSGKRDSARLAPADSLLLAQAAAPGQILAASKSEISNQQSAYMPACQPTTTWFYPAIV